jgi:hypothetical protein
MEKPHKKLDVWQAAKANTEPHEEEGENNNQKKRYDKSALATNDYNPRGLK